MADNIILRALKIQRKGQSTNSYTAQIGQDQRFGECKSQTTMSRNNGLISSVLHGGFAASLLVYTALEHTKSTLSRTKEQHVVSCQMQYLKPVNKTELQLEVEHLRVGKATASLRVVLNQKGSPAVTGDVK